MKREKINKKKEIIKIRSKKTKNLITNKRIKEKEPDLLKEVYSGLRLLGKKYKNFREKQKIQKQKEEQRRLKEQEEQRLQEQGQQKLQEQEERKLQKEQKLKEEEERRLLEEEQKPKEEGKRLNGEVKWFNGAKGYGFIEREDEEKNIFVHFSDVKKSGLKYLKEGEQLTFEIKNSDKGPSAINLQKVINLQQKPFLKLIKNN
jgi:CspA family cold shock protein